jgi:pimeloyl-ACP methyl ester carboxylesterase
MIVARRVNAFLFGSADRKLFGIHHPSARAGSQSGVVLCYPWGQEYLWAHRPFRSLATQLAAAGHEVLRFDYHGTGDSGGDLNDGEAPSWPEDVATAIDELKDMVDPRRIALCGLRMGAAWATRVAASRADVARLVAWDPILDGAGYLRALERSALREGDDLDVRGFRLTPAMRGELGSVTAALYRGVSRPTLVLTTREADAGAVAEALGPGGAELASIPGPCAWEEEGSTGMSGLPLAALHKIVEWLS